MTSVTTSACERWAERIWSGAGRKLGELERSGERTFQKTLQRERSVEREAEERERSGERMSQNRLERWAANRPLTLRSHALAGTGVYKYT